jgi:hypothetical protein
MSKAASFALLLVGGILALVQAGVFGLLGAAFSVVPGIGVFFAALGGAFAIWGIVVGIILIYSGVKIRRGGSGAHTWAIVGLIFSILGLITVQGFIIGAILGLVGAALGLGETKAAK